MANPEQARSLASLGLVRRWLPPGARPAESVGLAEPVLTLPDSGWGMALLHRTRPCVGKQCRLRAESRRSRSEEPAHGRRPPGCRSRPSSFPSSASTWRPSVRPRTAGCSPVRAGEWCPRPSTAGCGRKLGSLRCRRPCDQQRGGAAQSVREVPRRAPGGGQPSDRRSAARVRVMAREWRYTARPLDLSGGLPRFFG